MDPLFQLDCCHSVLTRHDTLSQNDVFPQNSIMRAIIEVSGCNQTHPKLLQPELEHWGGRGGGIALLTTATGILTSQISLEPNPPILATQYHRGPII